MSYIVVRTPWRDVSEECQSFSLRMDILLKGVIVTKPTSTQLLAPRDRVFLCWDRHSTAKTLMIKARVHAMNEEVMAFLYQAFGELAARICGYDTIEAYAKAVNEVQSTMKWTPMIYT